MFIAYKHTHARAHAHTFIQLRRWGWGDIFNSSARYDVQGKKNKMAQANHIIDKVRIVEFM